MTTEKPAMIIQQTGDTALVLDALCYIKAGCKAEAKEKEKCKVSSFKSGTGGKQGFRIQIWNYAETNRGWRGFVLQALDDKCQSTDKTTFKDTTKPYPYEFYNRQFRFNLDSYYTLNDPEYIVPRREGEFPVAGYKNDT